MSTGEELLKEIYGGKSSKGKVGIFARGKNVYNSGTYAAHKGGGKQYGRPSKAAIARKLKGMK